jgi:hypothetical protein
MCIFIYGFEWNAQCLLAIVSYDACDEFGPLDSPSRCEWIVPGTIEVQPLWPISVSGRNRF